MRSARHGLDTSALVGHELSANGDYLSFGYNNDATVHGIGAGDHGLARVGPVGPVISALAERAMTLLIRDRGWTET